MLTVEVVGVRVDRPLNAPVLLMRESAGDRYLPIWIAAPEASAIVAAMEEDSPPRPLTHDLFMSVLDALDHEVERVEITAVNDGVFFAELVIDGEHISARPSDAIALALRTGAPIVCAVGVMDEAGVRLANEDEEMVRFREFLDNVKPEDFEA